MADMILEGMKIVATSPWMFGPVLLNLIACANAFTATFALNGTSDDYVSVTSAMQESNFQDVLKEVLKNLNVTQIANNASIVLNYLSPYICAEAFGEFDINVGYNGSHDAQATAQGILGILQRMCDAAWDSDFDVTIIVLIMSALAGLACALGSMMFKKCRDNMATDPERQPLRQTPSDVEVGRSETRGLPAGTEERHAEEQARTLSL